MRAGVRSGRAAGGGGEGAPAGAWLGRGTARLLCEACGAPPSQPCMPLPAVLASLGARTAAKLCGPCGDHVLQKSARRWGSWEIWDFLISIALDI